MLSNVVVALLTELAALLVLASQLFPGKETSQLFPVKLASQLFPVKLASQLFPVKEPSQLFPVKVAALPVQQIYSLSL